MSNQKFCFLIEDDSDDREFFCNALQQMDPKVQYEYAENARDGLKKLKGITKKFPDFIFLDLNMSPIDGRECLIELKKVAKLADIPVIIYSTRLDEKIKYDTLKLGAFDHFQKPTKLEELVEYLERVLQVQD
jgi:DNA-binding NtrC family response regulator